MRPNDEADGDAPQDTRVWLPSNAVETAMRTVDGNFQDRRGEIEPSAERVGTLLSLLRIADSAPIGFDVTPIVDLDGSDVYYVLSPRETLSPGRYVVEPIIAGDARASFNVGAFTSDEGPDAPSVSARRTHSESGAGNSCGESRGKSFTLQHSAPFSLVAFGEPAEFQSAFRRLGLFTQDKHLTIGSVACSRHTWDFDDGPTRVSFATMDLAGNSSDWTEPERVYVEDPDAGFGCSASRARGVATPWWFAVSVLWAIRRRSTRRTSVDVND